MISKVKGVHIFEIIPLINEIKEWISEIKEKSISEIKEWISEIEEKRLAEIEKERLDKIEEKRLDKIEKEIEKERLTKIEKPINIVLGANNMDDEEYNRLYKKGILIKNELIYGNLFFNNREVVDIFENHNFTEYQYKGIIDVLKDQGYIQKGLDNRYKLTEYYITNVKKSTDMNLKRFHRLENRVFNALSDFQNRSNGETQLFIGDVNKVESWRELRDYIKSLNRRVDNIIFDRNMVYLWKPYDKDGFEIISIIYEILLVGGQLIFPKYDGSHIIEEAIRKDEQYRININEKDVQLFKDYVEKGRIKILEIGHGKEYILTKEGKEHIIDKIKNKEDVSLDIRILGNVYFEDGKKIIPYTDSKNYYIIFDLLLDIIKEKFYNGYKNVEEYDDRHKGKGYRVFTKEEYENSDDRIYGERRRYFNIDDFYKRSNIIKYSKSIEGNVKLGEPYYQDISSWLGAIRRETEFNPINKTFPYRIKSKDSEVYYQEIYIDLERQYIAQIL